MSSVAGPIQRNYQSLMQQLRDQHAVGVVVAVDGEIVWADTCLRRRLLEKYWPNSICYAAEAVITRTNHREADGGRPSCSLITWTDATRDHGQTWAVPSLQ